MTVEPGKHEAYNLDPAFYAAVEALSKRLGIFAVSRGKDVLINSYIPKEKLVRFARGILEIKEGKEPDNA